MSKNNNQTDLPALEYDDIRHQFADADLMMFEGKTFGSRFIQWVSGSRFSHVGLIAYWGDRYMLLQAEPGKGVQAVPLSIAVAKYKGTVEWYQLKDDARSIVDLDKLLGEARIDLGLEYNWKIGLRWTAHELWGWRPGKKKVRPKALFCSQFVERCFQVGGLSLTAEYDPQWTDPGEVSRSPHIEIKGRVSHNRGIQAHR